MTAPRPWRVNHGWSGRFGHCGDDSPILDANGQPVINPSEAVEIADADLQLIVDAVNAYGEPAALACQTCNGVGLIGGHVGQTAESFDYVSDPCPDCPPAAAVPAVLDAAKAALEFLRGLPDDAVMPDHPIFGQLRRAIAAAEVRP